MSVVKSKREQSQFEVYHHYYQLRREVTEFLLFDYGYSPDKARKQLEKQFSGRPYEELDDDEKERYRRMNKRNEAFFQWFMKDERAAITNDLRELGRCLFSANNIYPQYMDELIQRRLYQEQALGFCVALKQELQYTIETLPVNINKYTRFAESADKEIALIKAWRRSDNKFKKTISENQSTT